MSHHTCTVQYRLDRRNCVFLLLSERCAQIPALSRLSDRREIARRDAVWEECSRFQTIELFYLPYLLLASFLLHYPLFKYSTINPF